jgi:hypothetical protein
VRGGFAQAVKRDLELKWETLSCLDKDDAAEKFVDTITGSVVGDSGKIRIGFIHPDLKGSRDIKVKQEGVSHKLLQRIARLGCWRLDGSYSRAVCLRWMTVDGGGIWAVSLPTAER